MTLAVTKAPAPDIMSLLCGGVDGVVKTPRVHHGDFPVREIRVIPSDNYRWGSEEAMRADLKATVKDPSDGSQVCSYEMLKDSIRVLGVEEPVGIVQRDGVFRVVYGFTRVLAAQELGIAKIPTYVYDASLPNEEAQLLQLRENSLTLKRQVNWVSEVEMFQKLLGFARKAIAHINSGDLPTRDDGKRLTHKKAAAQSVARALGVSPSTMKNRYFTLEHLDPRVVKLSREGRMDYASASEFTTGDAAVPFKKEFITATLEALDADNPGAPRITAEAVRTAMRKLRDEAEDSTKLYEGDRRPTTIVASAGIIARQSPGALRDLCVAMWSRVLRPGKVTKDLPADQWETLRKGRTWFTVVGIGIGASDVKPPVTEEGAGSREELQHDDTAYRYVVFALVQAYMMRDLKMDAETFRSWMCASTVGDGKTKRVNRMEFFSAVQTVLGKYNHMSPLKTVVLAIRDEIRERVGLPV